LTTALRWAFLGGPVIAYMAVIFNLSAQSSPPAPGGIPDWLLHGVEYFGLTVLVVRAVSGGLRAAVTRRGAQATMVIVAAYAISDEVHQLFVPYRTADVRDVLADLVGASLALLVWGVWLIISNPKAQIPKPKSQR
jgi:VanZ family protein